MEKHSRKKKKTTKVAQCPRYVFSNERKTKKNSEVEKAQEFHHLTDRKEMRSEAAVTDLLLTGSLSSLNSSTIENS
ncbi:hypothetical protein OUZ56_009205 [Daphnia magna]|uniref:Uncharacterized protein n=1 Tax=Daphnia magna TaxID=35525 RepID=A0ABR0AFB4_9CRUS|nr:hypothetical protein OUZ56_009205 [Daphnia magna]